MDIMTNLNVANDKYVSDVVLEVLQIHNWGVFSHPDPIFLSKNNIILGVAGTGKTMTLDAISYLLFGNVRFNVSSEKQAGEGDRRSVLAMIRGSIHSEEQEHLRDVGSVSYLMIQGFDRVTHSHFVLGACLEVVDTDRYNVYRFALENTTLNMVRYCNRGDDDTIELFRHGDIRVIDPSNPVKQPEKIKFYTETKQGVDQFMSVLNMRGVNREKLVSKINQIMAYNKNSDINEFVRNNVLPEAAHMNVLYQLQEMQNEYQAKINYVRDLEERRDAIGNILDLYSAYLKAKQKHVFFELCNLFSEFKCAEKNEKKEIANQESLRQHLKEAEESLRIAKKNLDMAYDEKARAEAGLSQDEKTRIEEIKRQIEFIDDELDGYKTSVSQMITATEKARKAMDEYPIQGDLEKIYNLSKKIGLNELSSDEIKEVFDFIRDWKNSEIRNSSRELGAIENQMDVLKKSLEDITRLLDSMKQTKSLDYPANYKAAKKAIVENLRKDGVNESELLRVRHFSETIEEIDKEWQPAIEQYLGDRRFHIIVPDKYNMRAYDIVRNNKIYRVDIPYDTHNLRKEPVVMENSAAKLLKISYHEARVYADFLLGRIKLCNSDAEMRQALNEGYIGAITKNGDVARANARHLNELAGNSLRLFIGAEAVKIAIEKAEKERLNLLGEIADMKAKHDEIRRRFDLLNAIPSSDSVEFNYGAEQYVKQFVVMRKQWKEKLDKANEDNRTVMEKIHDATTAYMNCQDKYDAVKADISITKNRIDGLNDTIQRLHTITAEKESVYAERERSLKKPEMSENARSWYEKASVNTASPIRNTERSYKAVCDSELAFKDAQREYVNRFKVYESALVGVGGMEYYRQKYDDLTISDIESGKNDIRLIEDNMRDTFCTNYIIQINDSIDQAMNEVRAINRFLSGRKYGNQTYKIECTVKTDGIYGDFKALVEELNINPNVGFYDQNEAEKEEVKELIRNYINNIMQDTNIEEFSDYRNYLNTDICIEEKRGDSAIHFKLTKKNASASTAEKATPFLIIMVISMYSILRTNKGGYRPFFMDEAFSVYSSDRIEQMMQLLDDLGFQCFFAGPDDGISKFSKYMKEASFILTRKPEGATCANYIDAREKNIIG